MADAEFPNNSAGRFQQLYNGLPHVPVDLLRLTNDFLEPNPAAPLVPWGAWAVPLDVGWLAVHETFQYALCSRVGQPGVTLLVWQTPTLADARVRVLWQESLPSLRPAGRLVFVADRRDAAPASWRHGALLVTHVHDHGFNVVRMDLNRLPLVPVSLARDDVAGLVFAAPQNNILVVQRSPQDRLQQLDLRGQTVGAPLALPPNGSLLVRWRLNRFRLYLYRVRGPTALQRYDVYPDRLVGLPDLPFQWPPGLRPLVLDALWCGDNTLVLKTVLGLFAATFDRPDPVLVRINADDVRAWTSSDETVWTADGRVLRAWR